MIFVTGGLGFIGSNFILEWFNNSNEKLINLDRITYAADSSNLLPLKIIMLTNFIKVILMIKSW